MLIMVNIADIDNRAIIVHFVCYCKSGNLCPRIFFWYITVLTQHIFVASTTDKKMLRGNALIC